MNEIKFKFPSERDYYRRCLAYLNNRYSIYDSDSADRWRHLAYFHKATIFIRDEKVYTLLLLL